MGRFQDTVKHFIPSWLIIYKNRKSTGVVLTFDDGPDEIITPKILRILKKHNIHALFFVIGQKVLKHPELVKKIVEEGHILGNHTFDHFRACTSCYPKYLEEIENCQQAIKNVIGVNSRFFRPPMGALTFSGFFAIMRSRLKIVLWSAESGEWNVGSHETTRQIHDRLLSVINNQDVLLMHDNSEKVPTVLETLIPALLNKGIKFANPDII